MGSRACKYKLIRPAGAICPHALSSGCAKVCLVAFAGEVGTGGGERGGVVVVFGGFVGIGFISKRWGVGHGHVGHGEVGEGYREEEEEGG